MKISYKVCDICNREIKPDSCVADNRVSLRLMNFCFKTAYLEDVCIDCNQAILNTIHELEDRGLTPREGFERKYT